jgi:hypothetical protein
LEVSVELENERGVGLTHRFKEARTLETQQRRRERGKGYEAWGE